MSVTKHENEGTQPAEGPTAADVAMGLRLREARRKRSLTLTQLAEYTGLSVGYLSYVERGQSSPTIANLQRICKTLGVSISGVLEPTVEERLVVRRADQQVSEYPDQRLSVRSIDFGVRSDEYELICIEPGAAHMAPPAFHPYPEVCVVTRGVLTVEAYGETYDLSAGDAIYIKANVHHAISNRGEERCETLWHYRDKSA